MAEIKFPVRENGLCTSEILDVDGQLVALVNNKGYRAEVITALNGYAKAVEALQRISKGGFVYPRTYIDIAGQALKELGELHE